MTTQLPGYLGLRTCRSSGRTYQSFIHCARPKSRRANIATVIILIRIGNPPPFLDIRNGSVQFTFVGAFLCRLRESTFNESRVCTGKILKIDEGGMYVTTSSSDLGSAQKFAHAVSVFVMAVKPVIAKADVISRQESVDRSAFSHGCNFYSVAVLPS